MTVRKQALISILLTTLLLILALSLFSRFIILEGFSDLEEHQVRRGIERIVGGISYQTELLERTAAKAATLQDPGSLVTAYEANPKKAVSVEAPGSRLGVDAIAVLDSRGRVISGAWLDRQGQKVEQIPSHFVSALTAELRPGERDRSAGQAGLVQTPDGPMIVAVRSLGSQQRFSTSSTRLVVARFLNVGDLERLAEGFPFTLSTIQSPGGDHIAAGEPHCQGLSEWDPVVVRPTDPHFIVGCALVNGLSGKPALMVRVEVPRETYRRGSATVQYFVLSLLGAGLIFAAVITYVLDKRIVSRLKDLGTAVSAIATGAHPQLRMSVSGSDELSLLAEQINGMLEALDKSESDLKQARDELEKRVEERTWQLLNTNELLMEEIDQRKLVEEDLRKSEKLLKESVTEKEVLLREIHHRVKNNLQVMASLLNLQSDYVRDEADLSIFKDAESRIWSMALVHETLYQSENLALIKVKEYVENLVGELFGSYGHPAGAVAVNVDVQDVSFGIDTAVPLGLIINELVSNAFKHAFPENRGGEILVMLCATGGGQFELVVQDSGIGMPEEPDQEREKSFGLHLVKALVRQLGGELSLSRSEGTRLAITFKEAEKRGKR